MIIRSSDTTRRASCATRHASRVGVMRHLQCGWPQVHEITEVAFLPLFRCGSAPSCSSGATLRSARNTEYRGSVHDCHWRRLTPRLRMGSEARAQTRPGHADAVREWGHLLIFNANATITD